MLHALLPPDGTTKYVDHVVGAPGDGVQVRFFTWHAALLGRFDVLHVHWPEKLIRDRSRIRRFAKRFALRVLPMVLAARRIPIVWTAHNPQPHEQWSAHEIRALDRFQRSVTLVIRLNDTVETMPDRAGVVVPHGHYIDRFARFDHHAPEPGRVLYFGILRPYKGVEDLIDAFHALPDEAARLRIVGDPHRGQRAAVEAAGAADPRVSADLRFVPDAVLAEEIQRASLVVLPYRERMGNSGSLLLALSLARPVLVPRSPTNEALSVEVGPGWIRQYDGRLTTEVLAEALRRPMPSGVPDLSGRDWRRVAEGHREAYDRAMAMVGR